MEENCLKKSWLSLRETNFAFFLQKKFAKLQQKLQAIPSTGLNTVLLKRALISLQSKFKAQNQQSIHS